MVQKSNEDNSSLENNFDEEFENEEGIHRTSETGIEDEANEEEKDLKSFSSSELSSWDIYWGPAPISIFNLEIGQCNLKFQ